MPFHKTCVQKHTGAHGPEVNGACNHHQYYTCKPTSGRQQAVRVANSECGHPPHREGGGTRRRDTVMGVWKWPSYHPLVARSPTMSTPGLKTTYAREQLGMPSLSAASQHSHRCTRRRPAAMLGWCKVHALALLPVPGPLHHGDTLVAAAEPTHVVCSVPALPTTRTTPLSPTAYCFICQSLRTASTCTASTSL
jgi:hypothetical protein